MPSALCGARRIKRSRASLSDFEKLDLNTNVAALMELLNALGEFNVEPAAASDSDVFAAREALEALVVMLAPFSPHVAEEMWEGLGHEGGLLKGAPWPVADAELAKKEELEIPVQVNGKLRSRVIVAPDISEADLRAIALADAKVQELYRRSPGGEGDCGAAASGERGSEVRTDEMFITSAHETRGRLVLWMIRCP